MSVLSGAFQCDLTVHIHHSPKGMWVNWNALLRVYRLQIGCYLAVQTLDHASWTSKEHASATYKSLSKSRLPAFLLAVSEADVTTFTLPP